MLVNNKPAERITKSLYLVGKKTFEKEWVVICPDCHKILARTDYHPNDDDLGRRTENNMNYLKGWAVDELKYHIRKESLNEEFRTVADFIAGRGKKRICGG